MIIEFEASNWKFGVVVNSYTINPNGIAIYLFNDSSSFPPMGINSFIGIAKRGQNYYLMHESFPDELLEDFKVKKVTFTINGAVA